jgi:hypothetical protein
MHGNNAQAEGVFISQREFEHATRSERLMPYAITRPSQIPQIRSLYSTLKELSQHSVLHGKYTHDKEFLNALTKSTNLSHATLYEVLPGFVYNFNLPQKGIPSPPTEDVLVDPYHDGPFTGTKPRSFQLGGWHCSCAKWKELVEYSCQILYHEHEQEFEACVLAWILRRKRDRYFSRSKGDFKQRGEVGGSIYVDTRLSSNNSVSLVKELCIIFGYSPSDFERSVKDSIR